MAYKYPYDDEEKKYKPPRLQTNRSMWKLMLLSLCTFGIYEIMFFIPFSFDIDLIAPKPDRSKTFNFLWAYILAYFTMSIVIIIWHYQMAERIEEALDKYNIDYEFSMSDFWLWYVVGSFFLVGPFVYFHKLCTAMNLLCEAYNKENNL